MENKLKVVSYCTTWWSMFFWNLLVYSKVWTNFSTGAVTSRATKMWTRAVETCHEIAPSGLFRLQTCQINLAAPQCLPLLGSHVWILSFIVLSERVLLHFPDFLPNCLALPAWSPGSLGGFTQILVRGVCAPTPPPQMSNSAVRSSNTLLSALFANRLH